MDNMRIMIVDDEEAILEGIKDTLPEYPIRTFVNPRAAEYALSTMFYDIIVADYKMPDLSGLDFFIRAKEKGAYHYGVLLTAYADKDLLGDFINNNLIHKIIEKPLRIDHLKDVLNEGLYHCVERRRKQREFSDLKTEYESMLKKSWFLNDKIIGTEGGLKDIFEKTRHLAENSENILLTGETGTGKDVIARTIHFFSGRKNGPFVKINCGAIPETLIEDELFGHVRGAYSGAVADKPGKIETARGGTLFLDEIAELKPELQSRLLQVVQEKRIERIGSTKCIEVDFRLLSATNQDLRFLIKNKQFREDLYYRIGTFHIHLPPLRERKQDIPLFIRYLLEKYSEEFGRRNLSISPGAVSKMIDYAWPGNIRELESVLKRTVSLLDRKQGEITSAEIGFLDLETKEIDDEGLYDTIAEKMLSGQTSLKEIENRILKQVLDKTSGRVYEAARLTGIPKDRFYRNVK